MFYTLIFSLFLLSAASEGVFINSEPAEFQNTIQLQLLDNSSLVIKGTSTLHSWDVEAREFSVGFEVPSKWFESDEDWEGSDIQLLRVVAPVHELDGGRSRMNRDLRDAMNADEYPEIEFEWRDITIEREDGGGYSFKVKGSVSIAGQTKDIEFESSVNKEDQNIIRATGEVELKMTDFGIDPPRALLGTIRTGDKIKVEFDILLGEID